MPNDSRPDVRTLDVPSIEAAAHLLMSIHAARIVFGRSREAGVEAWLSELREAITGALPASSVLAVLSRCRQLEIERAA